MTEKEQKNMKSKEKQAEEYKKEVSDISTFAASYVPNVCRNIYELFDYETLDTCISSVCLTADYKEDVERCLKQIRACFRMANMRYPLDLSVYEDTKSGRAIIITQFVSQALKFLFDKEKEPVIKEDTELTPLKTK